jgi:hypothetical protein
MEYIIMRKIIFFVLVLTSFISQTNAQGFLDPVTWDVSLEKNSGDLYTITMEAVLAFVQPSGTRNGPG